MTETTTSPSIDRVVNLLNSRGVGFERDTDSLTASSPEELDELRRLRSALWNLLAENGRADKAAAALDKLAASHPFRYRYTSDLRVALEPVAASATAQLLEDVAALIAGGNWARVKTCANEDCKAVFYDPTRARTRRWHSFELCGNKRNVAAFRQRREAE